MSQTTSGRCVFYNKTGAELFMAFWNIKLLCNLKWKR